MKRRRTYTVWLVFLMLLLLIGLTVFIWGAATYEKPWTPFYGPWQTLRESTFACYFAG